MNAVGAMIGAKILRGDARGRWEGQDVQKLDCQPARVCMDH